MTTLNKFLHSGKVQFIALILGVVSSVIQVIQYVGIELSPSWQLFGRFTLGVFAFYILLLALQWGSEQFISHTAKQIADKLIPTSNNASLNAETAYIYSATRYGIGYESLHVQWVIQPDGSASVQRTVKVVAFSQIEKIDTYLLIPEISPEGNARIVDFVRIESLSKQRKITLTEEKPELGKLSALINISPPLRAGENEIYQMEETLPSRTYAIRLSKAELQKRKTPQDYAGWAINRPTKSLVMEVFFPDGVVPKIYSSEVRYASASGFPSERRQQKETESLSGPEMIGPNGGRYHMRLKIDHPMTGLIYILSWNPVEKAV